MQLRICMNECIGVFPRWESSNIISGLKTWGQGNGPCNESQRRDPLSCRNCSCEFVVSARRGYRGPAWQSWNSAVSVFRHSSPLGDLINNRLPFKREERKIWRGEDAGVWNSLKMETLWCPPPCVFPTSFPGCRRQKGRAGLAKQGSYLHLLLALEQCQAWDISFPNLNFSSLHHRTFLPTSGATTLLERSPSQVMTNDPNADICPPLLPTWG